MKTYTKGIGIKGATVMKYGKTMTVSEVLRDLNATMNFKYPIGASIYNPNDPDLRGIVVGQMFQAHDAAMKLPEGKMYMIKTESGAISELEFIFEDDAVILTDQEVFAVA